MSEALLSGHDEDRLLKQFMGQYDAPAYVRRARHVQAVFDELISLCRARREETLALVRIRLGTLAALAGDWSRVGSLLAHPAHSEILQQLCDCLKPCLRDPIYPTRSRRMLRRAIRELASSMNHFNQRWRELLAKLDLQSVNDARDGYNRYYLLEKECAVRSAVLARQGFRRLEFLTREHLEAMFPELPAIQLAEDAARA
jgi:hypothetical protein